MGKKTKEMLLKRMAQAAAKREYPSQQQPDVASTEPKPSMQAQQVQSEQPQVEQPQVEPQAEQKQPLMQAGAQQGETAEQTEQRLDDTPVKKRLSYKELYEKLNPQPTPEELEKRRKKEKRDKMWASIGDGLNALSSIVNLYYTTKRAPSMYEPKDSLSDKAKERWEKLNKEFDAKDKAYAAGIMKAQQLDEEAAENEKKWKRLFDKDKEDAERRKKAVELAAQKAEDNNKRQQAKLEEQIRHNKEMEAAAQKANEARLISAKSKGSKSGSGSGTGGKYIVYPPASSGKKPFAVANKSMYDYWNEYYYGSGKTSESKTYTPDGEHVISSKVSKKAETSTQRAAAAKAAEARAAKQKAEEAKKKATTTKPATTQAKKNGYANTKKLGL